MMYKVQRRFFSLLEVLLALFLVTLCIIPLLSPSVAIYRDQQRFVDKIDLDHAAGVFYAQTIEKLHRNAISWEELNSEKPIPIDSQSLQQLSGRTAILPWKGSYSFKEIKRKPKPKNNEQILFSLHLFQLILSFKPRSENDKAIKPETYTYDIFLARQQVPS